MLIRTRLSLLSMAILTVALGVLGWVVFEATRGEVLAEIERDVRTRARALASSVERGTRGGLEAPDLDVFTTPDTYIEVTTPHGNVLKHSSNLQDHQLPFPETAFQEGRVAEAQMGEVPVVVYGSPVRVGGESVGYVVVGRSPGPLYQVLHRLQAVLISGTALVLLLTGLAIWFTVRAAMGPLVRLASAAAEIAQSQDHSGRVAVPRRAGEIGQLGATLNGMLNALENIHREIEGASVAQRRFLMDVSHELRAPLTIMLSSLELLQRVGSSDPEFRDRALADTRAEAERVARMVTQLLIMARTGTSASAANKPLRIGEIVAALCRKWTHRNGRPELRCRLENLEEAVIHGNEDHLRQLFFILLDNAFKFTPDGGTVDVNGAVLGDVVEISVNDTGSGIASEDL